MGYARIVVFMTILAGNVLGCAHPYPQNPERVRSLAREFKAGWVGADAVPLERWENRVVLVSFFATWCFPCLLEMPVLQKLHESYAADGLLVVLAGMDLEKEKTLQVYSEMSALPFPVVIVSEHLREGNTWLGPIRELPTHLLINRQGKVVFVKAGALSPEVLNDFKKWFR